MSKPQKIKNTDINIIMFSYKQQKMVKSMQITSIFSQADVDTCLVTYASEDTIMEKTA